MLIVVGFSLFLLAFTPFVFVPRQDLALFGIGMCFWGITEKAIYREGEHPDFGAYHYMRRPNLKSNAATALWFLLMILAIIHVLDPSLFIFQFL